MQELVKPKAEPQKYSTSQVSCFRSCKQQWSYRYQEHLVLRAPQKPLYVGSTLHKLLEIRANGQSWREHLYGAIKSEYDKMSTTHQEVLGVDFIESMDKIMQQYDWVYSNEELKYIATEVQVEFKIRGNKYFIGIVDAIVELNGEQYIMEHKSFSSNKMSMEQTWINQQTALYIYALNKKGYNIKGVIWDMIKTEAPSAPKILKDGSLGKQYGTVTLMSFYWAGIDPSPIREDIQNNHLNFVDRYITPVTPEVVDRVWKDFVETVNEIAKNKGCARNLTRACSWCSYKDLCQTELTGGDAEYIKQLLFKNSKEG